MDLPSLRRSWQAAGRSPLVAAGTVAAVLVVAFLGWRLAVGPTVPAYVVERMDLLQTVVATGRVESPRRVDIGSPLTGTVVEVLADEGDVVKAGQRLLALDDTEAAAAVAQARTAVAQADAKLAQLKATALPVASETERQAQANLDNAERALARQKELFARGFIGQAALDEAQRARDVAASQLQAARVQRASQSAGGADVRLAQTALDNARAAFRVAEARLELATIEAPVDGAIIARNVEKGSVVQPGKALLVLSPRGETQLVVQVDEKNLPLLALDAAALASADAWPERRFEARITKINPAVDPARGSVEVKLTVPDPPAYLLQDMTVSVDIESGRHAAVLTVPSDALRPGDWVLAVRDGRAHRQPVKIGARGAGRIEVVDGLHEGEAVLPAARTNVHDGQRVRAAAGRGEAPRT